MSWHTLFGAYVIPATVTGCQPKSDESEIIFHGTSRSGALEQMVALLLETAPCHDILRFVAAQACTEAQDDGENVTRMTRIDSGNAAAIVSAVDSLLDYCAREPARVAAVWDEFGGYCEADLADAAKCAHAMADVNSQSKWGEEGDSPHFVLAVLASLRAAASDVLRKDGAIIHWSWGRR